MVNAIKYTDNLIPAELSFRYLDGHVDVWLRKNPRTEEDSDGNVVQVADEAYAAFGVDEAPSFQDINEDFEGWFSRVSDWVASDDMKGRISAVEAKSASLGNGISGTQMALCNVTDNVAKDNYPVGSYFIYNNKLYQVTRAIARTEQIVVGYNVEETNIMSELIKKTEEE